MNKKKLLKKILDGSKNIRFTEFVNLIEGFGFVLERVSGSHHIFKRQDIDEIINIQNVKGEVKPYQIKQFFSIIEKYNIKLMD